MKKILLFLIAIYTMHQSAMAQFPGYSRFYVFDNSANSNPSAIDALLLDENNQDLYFILNTHNTQAKNASKFVKADIEGNIQYQLTDTAYNKTISYSSVSKSLDGQYLYWFGTFQDIVGLNNLPQLKLVKTDLNLNKIWERFYPLNASNASAISVKNAGNNNLMIYFSDSGPSNALRLDSAGNVLNFYNIGGGGIVLTNTDEQGWMVISSGGISRYDSLATQQWANFFGAPPSGSDFRANFRSNDTNETYFAAGRNVYTNYDDPNWDATTFSGLVIKYDKDGQPLWRKVLPIGCVTITDVSPPLDFSSSIGFQSIANTSDNGCVLAGAGSKNSIFWGQYKAIVARLDNNGNAMWNYFYILPGIDKQVLTNIVSLPDGSFIASGFADESGLLLRVDSLGCYNASCTGMEMPDSCAPLAVNTLNIQNVDLNIYPNPTSNKINIQSQTDFGMDSWLEVYDIYGKLMMEPVSLNRKKQYTLAVNSWTDGHYFLKFKIDGQLYYRKIVVLH